MVAGPGEERKLQMYSVHENAGLLSSLNLANISGA